MGFGQPGRHTRTVSIIHTTDLHGHIVPTSTYEGVGDVGGFARCATQIRQWRRENPDSLLVDIGDVFQGTAESFVNDGGMMIGLFNRLGYDAWTLGNHDFDWGREKLEANLALSKAPVLTGNLEYGGKRPGDLGKEWRHVLPWVLKEAGGFRIALIGLITPGLPYWLTPETLGGVNVTDPAEALQRSIRESKSAGADAVVVMGHMGFRFQDDFANPLREMFRKVRGVDYFLGGHTHQNQPSWELEGVPCTQAAYYGIYCGKVDLTFDLETRELVGRQGGSVFMDHRFELDPAVMEFSRPELKKSEEMLGKAVGVVTKRIEGKGKGCRLIELFCECFSEALERDGAAVDGVFHGSFGTGDIEPGNLTVADCWRFLPYENLLLTAEVRAEELIEIVKEDLGESNSDRTLWPFQLALEEAGGIGRFLFKGEPVAAGRRFTIAFNSYDAQSGGQRLMKLRQIVAAAGAKRRVTSIDARTALIEGLLNRKEIS